MVSLQVQVHMEVCPAPDRNYASRKQVSHGWYSLSHVKYVPGPRTDFTNIPTHSKSLIMVGMTKGDAKDSMQPKANEGVFLRIDRHGCANVYNSEFERVGRIKSDYYQQRAKAYFNSHRVVALFAPKNQSNNMQRTLTCVISGKSFVKVN